MNIINFKADTEKIIVNFNYEGKADKIVIPTLDFCLYAESNGHDPYRLLLTGPEQMLAQYITENTIMS
jgi:hypothetical protein